MKVAGCDFKSRFQGELTEKVTLEQTLEGGEQAIGIPQERSLQEERAASAKALR